MPIATRSFAAVAADKPLEPFDFTRRDPGPDDVTRASRAPNATASASALRA